MFWKVFQMSFAQVHRENYRRQAKSYGIDAEFVSQMVDGFYTKVRNDAELGPIFDAVIQDQWEPHLVKMKQFWRAIALKTGEYEGRPMPAHLKLKNVTKTHFARWLQLFDENLDEVAPTPEAKAFFQDRARNIARSLMMGMFYDPDEELGISS